MISLMFKFTKIIGPLILILFIGACDMRSKKQVEWFSPEEKGLLVAHALGGIDGETYTNSKEAFLKNYKEGKRWFEVDLFPLKDGNLVCFHEGHEEYLGIQIGQTQFLNTDDFLRMKYDKRFTLLTFEDLLNLVKDKQDVRIITDTKGWDGPKTEALIRHIKNVNPRLINQIIPQIYQPDDMSYMRKIEDSLGKFDSMIFTLYMTRMPNGEALSFAIRENIPMVTVPAGGIRVKSNFLSALHQHNKYIFVHTVNDPSHIEQWKQHGIDGFYTDFYR